ncbi:RNA-directed DNA polymerase, eukaryota [Tanacetum coccineum]
MGSGTHFTSFMFLFPLGITRLVLSFSIYINNNTSYYRSKTWLFSNSPICLHFAFKGCGKVFVRGEGSADVKCVLDEDKLRGVTLMNLLFVGHSIIVRDIYPASFNEEDKDSNTLNDEIMGEASNEMKEEFQNDKNTEEESDAKEVFESRFVNEGDADPKIDHVDKENNKFANPFNIYDILNKNQGKSQVDENSDSNLKYPLRFTPAEKDACFATKENNMEDLQNGAYKEEEIEHGLGFVGSIHAIINKIRVGVDMSVGMWISSLTILMIISVYAPQELLEKAVMGLLESCDRLMEWGGGLVDIPLGGYDFTWAHISSYKMNELLDQRHIDYNDLSNREEILKSLQDLEHLESMELIQKAKVKWSIEGDENPKFFHRILNNKRSQVAICVILVNEEWVDDPIKVKHKFLQHFKEMFHSPFIFRLILDDDFTNHITSNQNKDLKGDISHEEI